MVETKRGFSKGAEKHLNVEYPILDHGFVRLVDYMGNDSAIVQAARVSYGAGTKSVNEDRGLIRYLMKHKHTTPFEMVEFKWHVKMPIFVARQWIRHRTANVNEYSMRYSEPITDFYLPDSKNIRMQSKSNMQGRSQEKIDPELAEKFRNDFNKTMRNSFEANKLMSEQNVARELSRINLPVAMYTEFYWKNDLHNTFHFLNLRMDKHAQWEIQQYANKMGEIIKDSVPIAYGAFEDYTLNAISFSKIEQLALKQILKGKDKNTIINEIFKNKREKQEFLKKLSKFK